MSASPWSLPLSLFAFVVGATVIAIAGTKLSALSDRLADRTGWGEAFIGAFLLGTATSLADLSVTVTAAVNHYPALAVANVLGGIAIQTVFLVIADMSYRRANLEHAAASMPNIMLSALLITLLALALLAMLGPEASLLHIHPATALIFLAYLLGMRLVRQTHRRPMWRPLMTSSTRLDIPAGPDAAETSLGRTWAAFALYAVLVAAAGWGLAHSGIALVGYTGLSQSLVGGVFLAVATSLPELVTALAAVRRGALTLAVGVVIGGNASDTLLIALADLTYRGGSVYHAVTVRESALITIAILMAAILLLGLLYRQQKGVANVGFEGILVLILYGVAVLILGT